MVEKMKQAESTQSSNKRVLMGQVVSDKMDKTVVVKTTRMIKHPFYGKIVKRFKKYKVHDEQNACKIGDIVEFVGCRPLSKDKHMTLSRIVTSQTREG